MSVAEHHEDHYHELNKSFLGTRMCEMTEAELDTFLTGVAQRGATNALKAVGLDDEDAVDDVRDLRDILKSFRVVKKTALSAILAGLGRVIAWVVIITLAGALLEHNPMAKQIAKLVAE